MGRRVGTLQRQQQAGLEHTEHGLNRTGPTRTHDRSGPRRTHQRFGVTEDVVLEELVQHVEAVVLDQRLDDQLVQVMLETTNQSSETGLRRAPLCPPGSYLDRDLVLVQGADVLHHHGDDELVGDVLQNQSRFWSTFVPLN